MSQASNYVDPRSQITHTLDEGQVYQDDRTDEELVLVFLSEDAALLKDEGENHRLERRDQFEENVGSDRYGLQADADGTATTSSKVAKLDRLREKYEEESGRTADHKASALDEALELIENNGRPDDNDVIPFEEISGIGSKAANALRRAGYTTKGDVRSAERSQIVDLAHMGEKNTDNLLAYVSHE